MKTALLAIVELQNAKGSKAKHAVLLRYRDNAIFNSLLYYACHPRLTYKLSDDVLAAAMKANKDNLAERSKFHDIFDLCYMLSHKKAMDDVTLKHVALFLLERDTATEMAICFQILTKTLRLGVTHKSINKAIPGLFPEWNIQQAYPVEKHPLKDGTWFALTQKLNGVRCTYYRGQLIARSGEPFEGLDHIADELSHWPDLVFDGELTLKDKGDLSDNEAFRVATGIINSDGDKSRICFTIFDMLYANEFDNGQGMKNYFMRRELLTGLQNVFDARELKNVSVLPVLYMGTDQSQIDVWLDRMVEEDKEGLMVNLNVPYKCKRHSGILKVKRFYTMDLPIIRVEEGTGKYAGLMGNLVVDYKGNEVGVGSGFCDGERELFWRNREQVVGMLIEVKYKEISANKKTGAESLQFPVYVQLRPDKDDVSYG